jgi:tetratricopeptide (TPR) repeat protein
MKTGWVFPNSARSERRNAKVSAGFPIRVGECDDWPASVDTGGSRFPKCHISWALRLLKIICMILGFAGPTAPAIADQNDPRIGELCALLSDVSGPIEAAPIEGQIWAIWFETSDQSAASLLEIGRNAMRADDHLSALQAFDRLVAVAPGFAEGWNMRGTVHYLVGNLEKSLDDIATTISLEPRHFGALSGRGLVYVGLNDPERALSSFEAALSVHPHMIGPGINAEAIRRFLGQEI